MPIANGTHDHGVPFATGRRWPDGQHHDGQHDESRTARNRQREPEQRRHRHDDARAGRGDGPGRDRLARLAPGVGRRVDDVVERADRELERGHRCAEAQGGRGLSPGEHGDREHDEAVEDRREWMNETGQPRPVG